ncbi:hypothetical protein GCM10010359_40110 [Streptomyces morookaense]|nr:hypothetical protein GCM10010359_40110 [Streptomyces morookaense]
MIFPHPLPVRRVPIMNVSNNIAPGVTVGGTVLQAGNIVHGNVTVNEPATKPPSALTA